MIKEREKLLELLANKAFKYSEEPVFKLASGKVSQFYINCKMVTLDPEGLNLIGNVVNELVDDDFKDKGVDAVGGLTLGADPISVAASLISHQRGRPFKAFVIRKEAKPHGLMKWVEGDVSKDDGVLIMEDVITTGMSTLKALDRAREEGLNVLGVIALVDREEGGVDNIKEKYDLEVVSIVKKSELLLIFKGNDSQQK